MLDTNYFKTVLDSSLNAIAIAEYVFQEGSSVPDDFTVLYINNTLQTLLSENGFSFSIGTFFSKSAFASSSIHYMQMIQTVYMSGEPHIETVDAPALKRSFSTKIYPLDINRFCIDMSDVTRQQENERKLEFLAYNDVLTKLPNKNRLMKDFDSFLEAAALTNTSVGAMFIVFDNLKKLCDTRGHAVGDELISKAADRLSKFNTNKLISYRFSSDAFLCLAKNVNSYDEMVNIADSLQEILQEPYFLSNFMSQGSLCIGIAMFPDDAQNATDLLKYADNALSHALHSGSNSVAFFQHIMHEKLLKRVLLEKRLTLAVDKKNFHVNYQPQYESTSGKLRGFEALIRWNDPVLGKISPDDFIPVAEETGEIVQIGEWVLKTACKTCKKWIDSYGFGGTLSVNVSPVQMKSESFLETLQAVLDETQFPAEQLEIEITEGALIDDFDNAVNQLKTIKNMGIKIALDDFGTGYSSLSYLQQLPLTTLKLDKSFVFNIQNNSENQVEETIADAIVSLASRLGLHTVAEGVETLFQHDFLTSINCDLIQGFLTGRPMPVEECQNLIFEQNVDKNNSQELTDGTQPS